MEQPVLHVALITCATPSFIPDIIASKLLEKEDLEKTITELALAKFLMPTASESYVSHVVVTLLELCQPQPHWIVSLIYACMCACADADFCVLLLHPSSCPFAPGYRSLRVSYLLHPDTCP